MRAVSRKAGAKKYGLVQHEMHAVLMCPTSLFRASGVAARFRITHSLHMRLWRAATSGIRRYTAELPLAEGFGGGMVDMYSPMNMDLRTFKRYDEDMKEKVTAGWRPVC